MRIWTSLCLMACSRYSFAAAVKPTASPGADEFLRMLFALLVVLLFICIVFWLLRRLQKGGFSLQQGMRFISSMSMGSRERLVLVEVGGRYLLLGVTSAQVNLLCDFGDALPSGFDTVNKPSFTSLLQHAMGKKS
ncbi:MAG: flagellar biosynthetic protein FliO [Legionellaceae bacterium]|nr:flagellar biosynthetic protein FliO [Legionellaceae bacterium]